MIELIEFLSFIYPCRVEIFDCGLSSDSYYDDDKNNDPIIFYGDSDLIPAVLLSRFVKRFTVSDEYVNCLYIELAEEGEKDE